jgi:hypothetical protein
VIFFATIPIVGIYKYLLHGRPPQKVLSIDESGIKIYSGVSDTLSWHEIESISKVNINQNKCQALSLSLTTDKYDGYGDINIDFYGISPSLDDAIREINKYYLGGVKDVLHE